MSATPQEPDDQSEVAVKYAALVPFTQPEAMITSLDEIERIAKACAASGFYKDVEDASQAVVKMLAGQEMGVGPIRALAEIHIVEGKPSAGAGLIAANVKRSGRYDYRLLDRSDERCEIQFFEHGKAVGTSCFTMEDAKRADLARRQNWKRYPRAMLFARALTEGVRVYCPDASHGVMYTPEELQPDIEVNEHGTPQQPPPTPRAATESHRLGNPLRREPSAGRAPPTPGEEALGPQHGGELDSAAGLRLSQASIESIEIACRARLELLVEEPENWAAVATGIVRDLGYQSAAETPDAELPGILRAISTWDPKTVNPAVGFDAEGAEDIDQRPKIDPAQHKLLFARAAELFPTRNSYQVIHEVIEPLGFAHLAQIRMESLDDVLQGLKTLADETPELPDVTGQSD